MNWYEAIMSMAFGLLFVIMGEITPYLAKEAEMPSLAVLAAIVYLAFGLLIGVQINAMLPCINPPKESPPKDAQ